MRTTLRIETDLLDQLKALACVENVPLTRLVNRVLRTGLGNFHEAQLPKQPYREETYDLGKPTINLDNALAVSAAMEDEEILRKIEFRK